MRSSAHAILDNVKRFLIHNGIDPFKRIFNWLVDEADTKPARFTQINTFMNERESSIYEIYKKEFGYATSGSGRTGRDNLYVDSLSPCASYTGHAVNDITLRNQITSLTKRNGRIDHESNAHDDLVIAWLLAYWFLANAKNIEHYGIKRTEPLSDVDTSNRRYSKSKEDERYKKEQDEIKSLIEENLQLIKTCKNEFRAIGYRNKALALSKKLDPSHNKSLNINARLEELKMINRKNYTTSPMRQSA
jgi:hypothetical protein